MAVVTQADGRPAGYRWVEHWPGSGRGGYLLVGIGVLVLSVVPGPPAFLHVAVGIDGPLLLAACRKPREPAVFADHGGGADPATVFPCADLDICGSVDLRRRVGRWRCCRIGAQRVSRYRFDRAVLRPDRCGPVSSAGAGTAWHSVAIPCV